MTEALTLVLANYNQAHLLRRSVETLETITELLRLEVRFVLVDDRSTDATWAESQRIAEQRTNVRLSRQPRNHGRGRAVADGVRLADTELVGTLDTDLEVPAHALVPLVAEVRAGADVALARRNYPMPLAPSRLWELGRWVSHRGYRVMSRAFLGTSIDTASGCKVMRRSKVLPLLDEIRDERWFWDTELIARGLVAGWNVVEVDAYCRGKPRERSTFDPIPEAIEHVRMLRDLRRSLRSRS
jgi:glycosyltransferase involved in cell wall biosynthesis